MRNPKVSVVIANVSEAIQVLVATEDGLPRFARKDGVAGHFHCLAGTAWVTLNNQRVLTPFFVIASEAKQPRFSWLRKNGLPRFARKDGVAGHFHCLAGTAWVTRNDDSLRCSFPLSDHQNEYLGYR